MKAILEFSLPDEEREYRLAARAQMMERVIGDIDASLRSHLKYGPANDIKTSDDLANWLRQEYTIPALNQINTDA